MAVRCNFRVPAVVYINALVDHGNLCFRDCIMSWDTVLGVRCGVLVPTADSAFTGPTIITLYEDRLPIFFFLTEMSIAPTHFLVAESLIVPRSVACCLILPSIAARNPR